MKKKKVHPPSVPFEQSVMESLKENPHFAAEYLKAAIEEATDEIGQAVLLTALKRVAEAQGISKVARAAGIPRASLYRAFSEEGNPRCDTLFAVVGAMGLRMTVEPAPAGH